jgi:NAD-dependent SIR2 family protein deacetylase
VPGEMMLDMMRDLSARIRHRDIIIRNPLELEELLHILLSWLRHREIHPNLAERILRELHELMFSLEELPPSMRDDMRYRLRRAEQELHHYVMEGRFPEESQKPEKREKSKEELQKELLAPLHSIKPDKSEKVLFFLGAGASKPSPSNIPTVNELLPELWKKSSKMETKPLEKLQTWCRENNIENIEEMLTAVTISNFIIKNTKVHGLLNSVLYPEWKALKEASIRDIDAVLLLENMLNTFFSLLVGTMLQAKPNAIHTAIAEFAKKRGNVDVFTTNYDSCIDQALDQCGIEYYYGFKTNSNADVLSLIKMHGSINWFYCDTCQSVFLPSIETVASAIEKDIPYAVTGMCRHCNAPVKQFIIPPVAHKYLTHPPIVQIWDCGRRIVEQANVFVIIGYSFSDADDYIAKMLVKAVGQDPKKKVIIVDVSEKAINRCKSFITSHVDSFDEKKSFFPLLGNGLELVPQIIQILSGTGLARSTKRK